jgi:hypothetical protein
MGKGAIGEGDLPAFVDCRFPLDYGVRPVPTPSTCSRA